MGVFGTETAPDWMLTMDIQLTYSGDGGETYHRAGAREPILKCGARDGPLARESGTVYPPSAPFVHGEENEIWLYYHGNNLLHGERTRDGAAPSQGLYLAKIPRDRLVCLKPGDEHEEAVVTTVPLALSDALRLNVEVQDGGEVYVTLLDAWGSELAQAAPITTSGLEQPVSWLESAAPGSEFAPQSDGEEKMTWQLHGSVKVRVALRRASLFAIYHS